MIAYLKGKVIDQFDGGIVLDVNNVGYEIYCSSSVLSKMTMGVEGGIYTYLQVKEDGVCLYGFDTKQEKNMFLKLISVSGIGPKMGITVLSGMRIDELATAIAISDVKTLSKIKGLGKKTAERLILELRESVSITETESGACENTVNIAVSSEDEDAVIALMGLGFNSTQSKNAIKLAREQGASTIEEVIAFALKSMNK